MKIINRIKQIFSAFLVFLRSLAAKPVPPAIGSRWVYIDNDPFTRDVTVEVVDVLDGYVKYEGEGQPETYSTSVASFYNVFKKA